MHVGRPIVPHTRHRFAVDILVHGGQEIHRHAELGQDRFGLGLEHLGARVRVESVLVRKHDESVALVVQPCERGRHARVPPAPVVLVFRVHASTLRRNQRAVQIKRGNLGRRRVGLDIFGCGARHEHGREAIQPCHGNIGRAGEERVDFLHFGRLCVVLFLVCFALSTLSHEFRMYTEMYRRVRGA